MPRGAKLSFTDGGHGKPADFLNPERVRRNTFRPAGRERTIRGKETPQC